MEFSCHIWAFNDLILPQALGTIARLGFRYVDMGTGPHFNPTRAANPQTRDAVLHALRQDLQAFNLQVADFYLMLPRISVSDAQKRKTDLVLFKAMLPFARLLNAGGVTISPGLIHPAEDEAAQTRTIDALQEMIAFATEIDMPLSIEPHLDSMAQTPQQALALVEAVAGLQITLDWAHMIAQGIRHQDILSLLPYTRHVQMRQAARNKLQTPFDKGSIDLDEVLNALAEAEYEGYLSVEYMQTVDWHGMMVVNSVTECVRLRDALRERRDKA